MRIDYLGAEDGGWQYWVNGIQAYIDVNLSATLPHEIIYSKKETGSFLNSALQGNPRLGTYLTVAKVEPPLVANGRVEGRLYNASVEELDFISNMSASATYLGSAASNVLDGNINTVWNSDSFPNANPWIELDLGSTQSVKKVRMLTLQSPARNTTHLIYAGNTPNPTTLIATTSAFTSDNQWINIDVSNWISARYIRIKTINSTLPNPSPSWVAWRDIQVYK